MTWQTKDSEIVVNDVPVTFGSLSLFYLFERDDGCLCCKVSTEEYIKLKSGIRNLFFDIAEDDEVFPAQYKGL